MNQPAAKTYRERALNIYGLFEEERQKTLTLISQMSQTQRVYRPQGGGSALDALWYLVSFQKRFSRKVLMLTWFRPLVVKWSSKQERETLENPFVTKPIIPNIATPITDLSLLKQKDKQITTTLRQRLNCFEHNEWLFISCYSRHLNRSLTFVQWVWLLIYLERTVRAYLAKLSERQDYPKT